MAEDTKEPPVKVEVMAEDTKAPPTHAEVAPASLDDQFFGLWASGIREASDPILKGRGGDLKYYDHVRSDPQVKSTLQQRSESK